MRFLFGVIIGIVLVPLGFLAFCLSGRFPAAATDPPLPMERELAGLALHSVVSQEAPSTVPIKSTEANLEAGAHVYREHCAVCHGLPGQKEPAIAKGMSPPPPQLFEKRGMVTDDPPGETFWKAKNGIRMTGMPGFQASLSDEQLWQVSLLLQNADKLPPSVQQLLAAPVAAAAHTLPDDARRQVPDGSVEKAWLTGTRWILLASAL
jgi:thiosulfate dehydrogenase